MCTVVEKIANPIDCAGQAVGDVASEAAASAGQSVLGKLMNLIATVTVNAANGPLSFWMDVPSANPLTTGYSAEEVPTEPQLWAPLSVLWESLGRVRVASCGGTLVPIDNQNRSTLSTGRRMP